MKGISNIEKRISNDEMNKNTSDFIIPCSLFIICCFVFSLCLLPLGNIGSLYTTQKKYKEAEEYLMKALTLADSIGFLDAVKEFNLYLSKLDSANGHSRQANTTPKPTFS